MGIACMWCMQDDTSVPTSMPSRICQSIVDIRVKLVGLSGRCVGIVTKIDVFSLGFRLTACGPSLVGTRLALGSCYYSNGCGIRFGPFCFSRSEPFARVAARFLCLPSEACAVCIYIWALVSRCVQLIDCVFSIAPSKWFQESSLWERYRATINSSSGPRPVETTTASPTAPTAHPVCLTVNLSLSMFMYIPFLTFTPPRLTPSATRSTALSTRTGHRLDGEIDDGICGSPRCAKQRRAVRASDWCHHR